MTEQILHTPAEDEIDLRDVIQTLLNGWRWIVGATIAGGLLALAVSMLSPVQYEASASLELTKPDVVFNFDPRVSTQLTVPPSDGLTGLVTSDSLLGEVLTRSQAQGADVTDVPLGSFQNRVSASVAGTVLTLTVKGTNPKRVAIFANAWADVATKQLNMVYAPSTEDPQRYAQQAQEALGRWQQAQQGLVDFQSTNQEDVLNDRLASLHDELRRNLNAQQTLSLAVQDAKGLISRLQSGKGSPDIRDDLVAFSLALRSLTSSSQTPAQSPAQAQGPDSTVSSNSTAGPVNVQVVGPSPDYQLQIDASTLMSKSTIDQTVYLSGLVSSMRAQQAQLSQAAVDLEGSIPKVQGELAKSQEARKTLETQRDLAAGAYQALANKAQEATLTAGGDNGVVRIASQATSPSILQGRGLVATTVLAGFLLFLVSSFAVIFVDWWQGDGGTV